MNAVPLFAAVALASGVALAVLAVAEVGCNSPALGSTMTSSAAPVDSGCRPNLALSCGFPTQGTTCSGAGNDPDVYGACAHLALLDGGADAQAADPGEEGDAGGGDYCCLNWSQGACAPDVQAGCAAGTYGFSCPAGHGPQEIDPSWTCAPGPKSGTQCCTYPVCVPDPSVSCAPALAGNTGWTCPQGQSPPSGSISLCSDGEPSANGLTSSYCCFPLAVPASESQAGCSAGGRGVCSAASDMVYSVACEGAALPSGLGFTESACGSDAVAGVAPDYTYYCCEAAP